MNVYPDPEYFKERMSETAKRKRLAVFEDNGTIYIMDETNGYVTQRTNYSEAANFINTFGYWPPRQ